MPDPYLPVCKTCDFGYRGALQDIVNGVGDGKTCIYDIDMVIVHGKYIRAVGEFKRYKTEYEQYFIPYYEYIGICKLARCFRVTPYIIIELQKEGLQPDYIVFTVNPQETRQERDAVPPPYDSEVLCACFPVKEGIKYTYEGFRAFFNAVIHGGAG